MRVPSLSSIRSLFGLALSGVVLAATESSAMARDAYDEEEQVAEPEEGDGEGDRAQQESESLSAGGLEAPEAMPEREDGRTEVEKELDEEAAKDDGRGLKFAWLSLDVGYQGAFVLDEGSLFDGASAPGGGGGFAYGAGVGVRVLYFTLGGRFRRASFSELTLWSVVGELGLRVPIGMWEPYAIVGLGYAGMSSLEASPSPEVTGGKIGGVGGLDVRVGGGLDIYLSDTFSVGTNLASDFLFLHRSAQAELCTSGDECVYASKGKGTYGALSVMLTVGLHF